MQQLSGGEVPQLCARVARVRGGSDAKRIAAPAATDARLDCPVQAAGDDPTSVWRESDLGDGARVSLVTVHAASATHIPNAQARVVRAGGEELAGRVEVDSNDVGAVTRQRANHCVCGAEGRERLQPLSPLPPRSANEAGRAFALLRVPDLERATGGACHKHLLGRVECDALHRRRVAREALRSAALREAVVTVVGACRDAPPARAVCRWPRRSLSCRRRPWPAGCRCVGRCAGSSRCYHGLTKTAPGAHASSQVGDAALQLDSAARPHGRKARLHRKRSGCSDGRSRNERCRGYDRRLLFKLRGKEVQLPADVRLQKA